MSFDEGFLFELLEAYYEKLKSEPLGVKASSITIHGQSIQRIQEYTILLMEKNAVVGGFSPHADDYIVLLLTEKGYNILSADSEHQSPEW